MDLQMTEEQIVFNMKTKAQNDLMTNFNTMQ